MNTTMDHLDRSTHVKIIVIALLGAALVLAIGKTAHLYTQQSLLTPVLEQPADRGLMRQRSYPIAHPNRPTIEVAARGRTRA